MSDALKNLRRYQQELAGIAYEQRSPRLANLADAINFELCRLAHASRSDVTASEGEVSPGKNS